MIAGLPEGLTSRPLRWEDAEAVYRLEVECEAFDDGEAEVSLSDVEAEWRQPVFDLATMSVGVFDADRLVAYADVIQKRVEAVVAGPASAPPSPGGRGRSGATEAAARSGSPSATATSLRRGSSRPWDTSNATSRGCCASRSTPSRLHRSCPTG
jgi:mycothiol synthase